MGIIDRPEYMHIALNDLNIDQPYVICPGSHRYPADEKISVWPPKQLKDLSKQF